MLEVKLAKFIEDYRIWCLFNKGKSGIVDLKEILWGVMFEPLKNINEFKKFKISKIIGTIVWDNGADIAPEYLLENIN